MKTSEFKKQVEELGLSWETVGDSLIIFRGSFSTSNNIVANINTKYSFVLSTEWVGFDRLSDDNQKQLLNVSFDYAQTPIEERKEEKKYNVHVNPNEFKGYLIVNLTKDKWMLSDKYNNEYWQAMFTQSEIDDLELRDDVPLDWDKVKLIEVDDDE